jgi:uncharacterized repeat protein (TIGR03803 family)
MVSRSSARPLVIAGIVTLLAGCAKSPLPLEPPIESRGTSPAGSPARYVFKTIYSFTNVGNDGNSPLASLIVNKGALFGTTASGGTEGWGTVFKVTTSGTERVLYSFKGYPHDGSDPYNGVTAVSNNYYGATDEGGDGPCTAPSSPSPIHIGCGIIFKVSGSGHEDVLYNFMAFSDGAEPNGGLTLFDGKLYGTTSFGGTGCVSYGGCGTVFAVSLSGKERVLYRFKGGSDGEFPTGNLTAYNGSLYGATAAGGSSQCGGCGTIFRVSSSGAEHLVYRFTGGANGYGPNGGLTVLQGILYGTTFGGGSHDNGTVFSLTTAGQQRVLYRFRGGRGQDGTFPNPPLIGVNGALYGTTEFGGGGSGCSRKDGCGTIFKLTLSGNETVLHRFVSGGLPGGGLLDLNGTLYGTTNGGGKHGLGSVFSIVP